MQDVTVEVEMGEGQAPAAVEVTVTQGAVEIRKVEVDPANPRADLTLDDGDYVVHATALVPHGTSVDAVFAVPVRVTVSPAVDHHPV
jgi:hypothetical protein